MLKLVVQFAVWGGMVAALLSTPSLAQSTSNPASARTIQDITALLDQYKPDPTENNRLIQEMNAEPPVTEDPLVLSHFFVKRSLAAYSLGMAQTRIDNLEKALSFLSRGAQSNAALSNEEFRVLGDLVSAWGDQDYRKSLAYADQALAHPRITIGWQLGVTVNKVFRHIAVGDFASAETTLTQADAILSNARRHPSWQLYGVGYRSYVEAAHAYLSRERGNLVDADKRYRSTIALISEDMKYIGERQRLGYQTQTESERWSVRTVMTRSLVITLQRMGRLQEAEGGRGEVSDAFERARRRPRDAQGQADHDHPALRDAAGLAPERTVAAGPGDPWRDDRAAAAVGAGAGRGRR